MMIHRRAFSTALLAGAATSLAFARGIAANAMPTKASNVVLVHGLFADGSCWSEVIARLQAAGLNATAVQNPLTTLPDAVEAAERVLARGTGAKLGVRRQLRLVGVSRWLDGISVHTQNRTFRYRPRTGPEAAGPRRAVTTAFADFCSSGGSPGNWPSLR